MGAHGAAMGRRYGAAVMGRLWGGYGAAMGRRFVTAASFSASRSPTAGYHSYFSYRSYNSYSSSSPLENVKKF